MNNCKRNIIANGVVFMKKMLIIDGNSILNRAYYGIRPLTNKDGLYTHAVYGMVSMIQKQMDGLKPDYCVVAFDLKSPTFRHKMYDQYKANRKGMPDELAVQLPYAKRCMKDMGFRVLTCEGYEADDVIGTVAKSAGNEGVHAYIMTGDRDSLQLIDENVSVLLVKTKETVEFNREVFFENYGVQPSVFVDVKALMGDTSDNIPGVAGIGEKTALKLIADFGNMDSLYASYGESGLSASVKSKLESGREMAYLSRDLALINTAAPVDTELSLSEYKGIDKQGLFELFTELEFFAFIKKYGLEGMTAENADSSAETAEKTVQSICMSEAENCFDEKTVAVYLNGETAFFCDGEKSARSSLTDAYGVLAKAKLICHDYKTLYKQLRTSGAAVGECAFDTMLAAYVVNSNRSKYALEDMLSAYLGSSELGDDPALAVYSLYECLNKAIADEGAQKLLFDIEIPLAKVLADMELAGFRIDVDGITAYGEELNTMAEELKTRIYSRAGEEFNVNSPKQLGEVLFERMGLPKSKKTKTGYSTNAEILEKLRPAHPIVQDILDYRQVTKLRSTYVEGLLKVADENGRVHTHFKQTGTATGRLSSTEPNLQNIPVRTELGRELRRFFLPENGDYVIIDADYSQIELRLLAHISNDANMIRAFREGVDVHTSTAATVFGVAESAVTSELRKRAKAVNFGIMYGIGAFSLSDDIGVSRTEAQAYIDQYLAGYPGIDAYLKETIKQAYEDGYVTTLFGRRRYIPELKASNGMQRKFGERVAMNSPIQGTAADIIKLAMVRVHNRLKEEGIDARLILQVHDELLIEAHRSVADRAREILKYEMENAVVYSVPLDVDIHIGNNWYEAK